MIRKLTIVLSSLLLAGILMNSCSFLKEVTTLGKCEFRVTTLENPELAGINVSNINGFGDIGLVDMGVISSSIIRGSLPLTFTLNIEARNPNPANAAINKLEYITLIDDVQIASGALNQRIEIPANGGVETIPLQLSTDVLELLSGESRQALVNFGLNLADASNRPTRVSVKVKPTIMVGVAEITYPGYFTLNYDFASGAE